VIGSMTDIAVVNGAAGALGQAVVGAFVDRGDRVVAVTRDGQYEGQSEGQSEGLGVERVRIEAADLTAPDQVEDLWQRLERRGDQPRWVVNTAGGYRAGSVADTDAEAYRFMLELNLGTAWWSCRAAAARLPAGGAIINVGSQSALTGGAGSAAYSVAKAAVVRLTTVLAAELAERGVRVNAVLPSVMDTAANRQTMPRNAMQKAVPTDDVAAVVSFLCSDAARAVTGAVIPTYGTTS
jgi:NAD(P)-dependent dehydrogenase (short-subunit alcohol dehydrogenase family)